MNASYKIVLLGVFLFFAAIVMYYVFSGPEDSSDEFALVDNPAPTNDPVENVEPEPEPRPTLDSPTPEVDPEPEPEPEPAPTPDPVDDPPAEETIGETSDDLPDAPLIDPDAAIGPVASADPPDELERPAPGLADDPATTEDPTTSTEEPADPDELTRPGPDTTDPEEETTEPEPASDPEEETSPRPIPPDPATIPRTYTVKAGDTFASIAEEYYGEERAWFDIAQANPSVDPKRLQVGQEIVLPNRDTTVREREEVRPPAPGRDGSYTVQPGDNLSKIAKRFYGDSEQWDQIYARNRQLIGPRPDALKVGMELVIPQAYDGAE